MATIGAELAQAAGAACRVTVIQCGWTLKGSKTESRGASGASIGVVPGLGCSGPQGSFVGSGGHGAAFLWSPPLELSEGRSNH